MVRTINRVYFLTSWTDPILQSNEIDASSPTYLVSKTSPLNKSRVRGRIALFWREEKGISMAEIAGQLGKYTSVIGMPMKKKEEAEVN